ncbi:MAG: ABC transporter ATP-binding protein [Acholeplasmataceae bacterium]
MKNIFRFLKPYRVGVIIVFVLVALRAVLDLLLPTLLNDMISKGLGISSTSVEPSIRMIWFIASIMIAVILISIIVTIVSGYLESKIAAGFALDLRKAVYQKIEQFSMREMDHFTTSSLITRTTNDIQQLQSYLNMLLRMIILQPILAIGAIAFSIAQQPTLSLVLTASVIALLIMLGIIFALTIPKFQIMQKLVDRLNLVTRENLSGLRVVRAYNTQEYQAQRIDEAALESKKLNIFVNRITGLMWPIMNLIMGATGIILAYLAAKYFIKFDGSPSFEPGELFALIQYAMRTIMSFMFLTMIFIMIPRARVSAIRIMEVLDMDVEIEDPIDPVPLLEKMKGEITFENVTFIYPNANAPVLSNISFTVKAGKTTAIIGSTGSGKSTLINLIPRFYEITEGSIAIDGIDIKTIAQNDLYSLLGYVPQKGILFSGTIRENILFSDSEDQSDENMIKAAEIAQAKNFIESLDDKYDYHIAQGGANVSGGQRQRFSIARAIAKNPLIYLFDDSFSALDYETDRNLRRMLNRHVTATKIIVAQRINTIRNADQIIVLDHGKMVGIGTHDELMNTCGVYQEIAKSQLSKEELA